MEQCGFGSPCRRNLNSNAAPNYDVIPMTSTFPSRLAFGRVPKELLIV
jgi:hypothetical protein